MAEGHCNYNRFINSNVIQYNYYKNILNSDRNTKHNGTGRCRVVAWKKIRASSVSVVMSGGPY